MSEDTKRLLSEINSGKNNPNYGTTWTNERREKYLLSIKQGLANGKIKYNKERIEKRLLKTAKTYKITLQDNSVHITKDLTNWCKENNLPLTALRKALKHEGLVNSQFSKGVRGSGSKASKADGIKIEYYSS